MDALLDLVRLRAADPSRATGMADVIPAILWPCATEQQLARDERVVGHPLPDFLGRLYSEVGNGGFGPDYGLLGVSGGMPDDQGQDALRLYESFREPDPDDPHWSWPAALLPVVHCGCAMYLCVDCSTPEGRLIWFEPNPHEPGEPWDSSFIPLPCDLRGLFTDWIEGVSWIDSLEEVGDD